MSQVDEGLIHAWLDGQLPSDEAARVERLVATDVAWSAAAADARGVTAGASRILGGLDDVPSVRSAGGVAGATRATRSLWREPWLRAAAAILLLVGVGTLTVKQGPSDQALVATKERASRSDSAGRAPAPAEVNTTSVPSAAPATRRGVADARDKSTPVVVSGEPVREENAAKKLELRLDAARGGGLAAGVVSGAALVPPAGAGTSTSANRQVMDATLAQRDQAAAKSLGESLIIDPRVGGCWLATDSAPGRAYLLKFIDPIATDLQRAAASPPVSRFAGPASASRVLPAPPKDVRVQHATPRVFDADSSFTAEWITGDARMNLIFAVRGDTLTGATHLAAGDVRYAGVPFRAVRVQCPP